MILGLFICIITLLLFQWYKRPSRFPPGPRGLPLCGVIPWMTRRPEIKFFEWSRKYGPVISARVGGNDWVVLNSYDMIMEAMMKQADKFVARPPNYILDSVFEGNRFGILISSGQMWQKNRKFGEAAFRHLGVGKRSFESSVQEEAKILVRLIEANANIAREWQKDVSKAIANVIFRVICGRRFEYTDELFIRSTDTVNNDPWYAMMLRLTILLPWTRFLPPIRAMLGLVLAQRKDMALQYLDLVEKHKATLDPNNIRDFIDAFLVEQQQEKQETGGNKHFCMSQLMNLIREFFIAGTDTPSNTVLWCFLGFLHFTEWQEKIKSEIKNVICEDTPSLSHRDSMPITQAYIQEIQRYCTLVPLSVPRCTTEDAAIYGYIIPKGTQVMINVWSAHNDPEYFDNPNEFRPDRFLDGNGNFIRSNRVIPFSVGPRHCLGEQLARMEIFLFLTTILQKFTIKEDTKHCGRLPSLDDGVNGVAYVPKPFHALFIPVS